METVVFSKSLMKGQPALSAGKSDAHRVLLLSALCRQPIYLTGLEEPLCADIRAMLNVTKALGTRAAAGENGMLLLSPGALPKEHAECCVNDCAAALRMAVPVFWALGIPVRIRLSAGLAARPLDEWETLARELNADWHLKPAGDGFLLETAGTLPAGTYEVNGARSSQFASGLLIALSAAPGEKERSLRVHGPIASRPYLDLTLNWLRRFGCEWRETEPGLFSLLKPGLAVPKRAVPVPPDGDQQVFWEVLNVLGHCLVLPEETQDGEVLFFRETLEHMSRGEQYADCSGRPDLIPLLALVCAAGMETRVLKGAGRLRIKESDRLSAVCGFLKRMGCAAEYHEAADTLTVPGTGRLKGGFSADAGGDHRMLFFLAAAASAADSPITVSGAECAEKSWPGFLAEYRRMGGNAL